MSTINLFVEHGCIVRCNGTVYKVLIDAQERGGGLHLNECEMYSGDVVAERKPQWTA